MAGEEGDPVEGLGAGRGATELVHEQRLVEAEVRAPRQEVRVGGYATYYLDRT